MILSPDINDYCFIDTETKALPWTLGTTDEDVTRCGSYRYAECAKVIMLQFAIGHKPVHVIAFPDFDPSRQFIWGFMPPELLEFHERAQRGEAWYAAWHMNFDRQMLNTISGCEIRPEMTIDIACQGAASNTPPELNGAAKFVGHDGKQEDGKKLIKLFTGARWAEHYEMVGNRREPQLAAATPTSHPDLWSKFLSYGAMDIDALRHTFTHTRPLPRSEWEEYWANERINDRGMAIDVDFAERCAMIAEANARRNDAKLSRLTGGKITAATQRERIANWLWDHTHQSEPREALVKAWEEEDNVTGEDAELVPSKLSVAEDRLSVYINYFEGLDEREGLTDEEYALLEIADARRTGASATPAKFRKALDYATSDDRLKGQFRFNGAQQTGRFSSTGVQVHNLVRASLTDKEHPDRELEIIEFINELTLKELAA